MPPYVLRDQDLKSAVLFGEGLAVASLVTAIGFVVVDVGGPERLWDLAPVIGIFHWARPALGGGPERLWHLAPVIGIFNWPRSMLAWDILVLNGYLVLNLAIPFYILYSHYRGREPNPRQPVHVGLTSILL